MSEPMKHIGGAVLLMILALFQVTPALARSDDLIFLKGSFLDFRCPSMLKHKVAEIEGWLISPSVQRS